MSVDLERFAFSFSNAIIRVAEKQYTAISTVSGNQAVERGVVYGTSRKPLKRAAGQLQMGEGSITFSDLAEGLDFIAELGDDPSSKSFAVDVTLVNAQGDTQSIEYVGCALSGFNSQFESGSDALSLEVPFSYMQTRVNGKDFAV